MHRLVVCVGHTSHVSVCKRDCVVLEFLAMYFKFDYKE